MNLTRLLFLLALPLIVCCSCSHKSFPTGNYQAAPIIVDGNLDEWEKPIRFVSSGGLVLYNVTNDNDNLYVALETHDDATAMKILRAGVNIYIDPSAGESKAMSIAFPMPASAEHQPQGGDAAKKDKNEQRENLLIQASNFTATGFKNMENRLYDVNDKSKIQLALKPGSNDGLAYEAIIPLQYIFGADRSKNTARNISVGVFVNALKRPTNYGNSSGGFNGGRRGGGGGGRRGGMGGGRNGSNGNGSNADMQSPDRTLLFREDANWYKFKLATK